MIVLLIKNNSKLLNLHVIQKIQKYSLVHQTRSHCYCGLISQCINQLLHVPIDSNFWTHFHNQCSVQTATEHKNKQPRANTVSNVVFHHSQPTYRLHQYNSEKSYQSSIILGFNSK